MHTSAIAALSLSLLLGSASAIANAEVTAVAQLAPRQAGSNFVGYISQSGSYSDARSCDYPQTLSTSGAYVQCCPTTGTCPFYTSCSSNTLLAAGATVPCDVNSALTCNTAVVLASAGANGGGSYLACWQTNLGRSPFTIVQNIGSASATGSATGAAPSGSTARSSSTASRTSSASSSAALAASTLSSAASSAASSASTSRNNGNHVAGPGLGSGTLGGLAAFVLALL